MKSKHYVIILFNAIRYFNTLKNVLNQALDLSYLPKTGTNLQNILVTYCIKFFNSLPRVMQTVME